MRALRRFAVLSIVTACGSDAATATSGPSPVARDASAPSAYVPHVSAFAPIAQLEAWQREIDTFDGGFRPTGSAAHEGYVQLLASELAQLGVRDVHTEPYDFTMWTPKAWSLTVTSGASAGPVALSGYVPYSGATPPAGVSAPLVYVPLSAIPVAPSAIAEALQDPTGTSKALADGFRASLAALSGSLIGKIVVFDAPRASVSLRQVTGTTLYVNDPGSTLSLDAPITRTDLSVMLTMNALLGALASSGAVGAVGVLDLPADAARGLYAPFFGTTSPNLPAVYVDRDTGAQLKNAGPLATAKLVLDAHTSKATSENLIGVLPGASDAEIILGSHTDGPNSLEDNGPVAILALASCLASAERPRTIRIVLSGGHFVGSRGLMTYAAAHAADLSKARVVLELEHLGAREWSEIAPGTMGLTGRAEMQLVATPTTPAFVDASTAFAKKFPRSVVATPPLLGEGHNFTVVPVIQCLTMPEYLLVSRLPTITTQLTDYALMQRQIEAFLEMERTLAATP